MTDNAPGAGRQRRRRQRRRPWADSRGRYTAPVIALSVITSPGPSAARPCGDTPFYVSPVGLTCSQHASLNVISCEAFSSIGLSADDVSNLLRNCPHACGQSMGGDSNCDGDDRTAGERRLAQNSCYTGCLDDPSYRSKYGLTCENHQRLDCESFIDVGFAEQEVFDLIVSCPCSCRIPCGTYTEAPSAKPSSEPTEDFYRCTDPTCQDDPRYRSKLDLACDNHARFDCTTMDAIGYSEEEISELVNRCPCACRTMCGDFGNYWVSDAPSSQPSLDVTSSPSYWPSVEVTSSPSFWPSVGVTSSPSSRPSPKVTSSPSSRPSVDASSSPSVEFVTESPTDLASAPPSVQRSKRPSAHPTQSPVTFDLTRSPSVFLEYSFSSIKLEASKQAVDALLRQEKPSTEMPSRSPISASPTVRPTADDPSQKPTTVPTISEVEQAVDALLRQEKQSTEMPSRSPISASPTVRPTADDPSQKPTTVPTISEVEQAVDALLRQEKPSTEMPSRSPISASPTVRPTADDPSQKPTTALTISEVEQAVDALLRQEKPSTEMPSRSPISASPTVRPTADDPSQNPTTAPTILELRNESSDVLGTSRISENDKEAIIGYAEEDLKADIETGGTPSANDSVSKALPVLATLFTLTIVGSAVFVLSKKYPGRFRTLRGRLFGAVDRMGTILRIARGEDLADIVSETPARAISRRKSNAANDDDSVRSTKSAVTFAKDLVTVFSIPSSIPMQRSVSFADTIGEELVTELGPKSTRGPSNSLDEIDDYLVDDYLESSSRSTTSGDDDTNSSGSTATGGTFDSADDPMDHHDSPMSRSGRMTLRAHVGNSQVEIPLPGMISSPRNSSPRSIRRKMNSWVDDAAV